MFPVSPVTFSMKFAKYSVGFFFFSGFFRAEMSIYFISGILAYLCKKPFFKKSAYNNAFSYDMHPFQI